VTLASVIARVCIVRIPRHVGVVGGKRGSNQIKEPAEEDLLTQFVVNDLVGPPPVDLLPVVKEELWERMQGRRRAGVAHAAARAELAVVIEREKEEEWQGAWEAWQESNRSQEDLSGEEEVDG
jgi:hypothetical protein